MDEELIKVSIQDRIATVTLNREKKLNALTAPMMDTLPEIIDDIGTNDEIRCVLITGKGRGFCAGGDLATAVIPENTDIKLFQQNLRRRMEAAQLLATIPKPTIALVNGIAAGAGMGLALACDLRISSESARFTTAFAAIGVSGDFGINWSLPRIVGSSKAMELMFTSDIISAQEALKINLINQIVNHKDLLEKGHEIASQINKCSFHAIKMMKETLRQSTHLPLDNILEREARNTVGLLQFPSTQTTIKEFLANPS